VSFVVAYGSVAWLMSLGEAARVRAVAVYRMIVGTAVGVLGTEDGRLAPGDSGVAFVCVIPNTTL